MPLSRTEFLPTNLLGIYSSPSGMTDPRTGLPYQAGGLIVGQYWDLTEAEAQNLSGNTLHAGRYRFVQIDSTATAANITAGRVGLMKTLALGLNFITSYDKGLAPGLHAVIFINNPTATQLSAGAYTFVQELGLAIVTYKATLTAAAPAVGDVLISAATGVIDDPTQSGNPTFANEGAIIGTAVQLPTGGGTGVVQLTLPSLQG